MKVYATLQDFKQLFQTDLPDERVEAFIKQASISLERQMLSKGLYINEGDELFMEDLKFIICSMVNRALMTVDEAPYSQISQTVGPYTESRSMANPDQRLYLTKAEKERLGLLAGKHFTIRPHIGSCCCHEKYDCW